MMKAIELKKKQTYGGLAEKSRGSKLKGAWFESDK
jgi:hypothetical protein